jgi:hypothetical protein
MPNIVLIDDIQKTLTELHDATVARLAGRNLEVRTWLPSANEGNAEDSFAQHVDNDTVLVVTDYDLTSGGQTGLFGSTIVDWCNRRLIPVGDYSRGNKVKLPKEPDQYEIRVPQDTAAAAGFILSVFDGFNAIRIALSNDWAKLSQKRSPAAILADILGRPLEESRLALYGVKIGAPNSSLMESISQHENVEVEKQRFIGYIIGHLLLNVILRFPGSIIDCEALAAFLAVNKSEMQSLKDTFTSALYDGPFSSTEPLYWLTDVEGILEALQNGTETDDSATIGKVNRHILESALKRKFTLHDCPRCGGEEGGFICAFTDKTVCMRSDCSVASNAWIPQGARLCRIEKTYYDEWAPMLGF